LVQSLETGTSFVLFISIMRKQVKYSGIVRNAASLIPTLKDSDSLVWAETWKFPFRNPWKMPVQHLVGTHGTKPLWGHIGTKRYF
jgi:hypothetical protein